MDIQSYRFYHCKMNGWGTWQCEERYSPSTPDDKNLSKCIPINKYIPKILDRFILFYENIPHTTLKSNHTF